MATTETRGAFLNRLRLVAIDATCFDVPDSEENTNSNQENESEEDSA